MNSITKEINGYPFELYTKESLTEKDSLNKSIAYYQSINQRRTVRDFSDKSIAKEVIENIIMSASSAPSGAHKQPWTFCAIANPILKSKIRAAAEKEEIESYENRMNEEWLKDLEPLGTDHNKPFLEIAPWLIVVFKKTYNLDKEGNRTSNYYVNESVGLASGFLLTAIHHAGLVALTHTPSPMNFLTELLERPKNEKPYLLIPVGHPIDNTYVPKLERRPITTVSKFYE